MTVTFLFIPNRLHVPLSIFFLLSFPCIIKRLAQLWGDQTGFAVSHARAVKLHEAKPEDGGNIFQQHTFARGVPEVTQNVGGGQAQEIVKIEMCFGVDLSAEPSLRGGSGCTLRAAFRCGRE